VIVYTAPNYRASRVTPDEEALNYARLVLTPVANLMLG
jgi:hypothetical protein